MPATSRLSAQVHPTAVLGKDVSLAAGVVVGPYAVIASGVEVGEGTVIGAGAQIQGLTTLGRDNQIHPQACVGFDPQDLTYKGEKTRLEVGDRNVIREFCTLHRGSPKGGGVTVIGNDGLFMAYSHIAHDCRVGDRVVFANGATLAGHVEVGDDVTISAFSSVHQFCRVGRHAYIGGYSVITRDALPWVKTVGQKPACYGLNTVGLRRKGIPEETLDVLRRAMRLLTRSKSGAAAARLRLAEEFAGVEEIDELLGFLASSTRGVITNSPKRDRVRGGGSDE